MFFDQAYIELDTIDNWKSRSDSQIKKVNPKRKGR